VRDGHRPPLYNAKLFVSIHRFNVRGAGWGFRWRCSTVSTRQGFPVAPVVLIMFTDRAHVESAVVHSSGPKGRRQLRPAIGASNVTKIAASNQQVQCLSCNLLGDAPEVRRLRGSDDEVRHFLEVRRHALTRVKSHGGRGACRLHAAGIVRRCLSHDRESRAHAEGKALLAPRPVGTRRAVLRSGLEWPDGSTLLNPQLVVRACAATTGPKEIDHGRRRNTTRRIHR